MGPLALEGIVENGRIRLRGDVTLTERAMVYVVVPGVAAGPPADRPARVASPRLVRPDQAADFAKQVIEVSEAPADGGRS